MDDLILKAVEAVESKITAMSTKAEGEMATLGKISSDTKTALDCIGIEQRILADRLLQVEQKASAINDVATKGENFGQQFVKSSGYENFVKADGHGRTRIEVKNTITNAEGRTFSERRPVIVGGAFRTLTIEQSLTNIPTTSNAIDWIRENAFTNAAAETVEGAQKPESSLTFATGSMPVSTIAHWLKITRQLAMDNTALAAYINLRMEYGVDLRVENQLLAGNGAGANLNGLLNTGNFTPHGYTAASLTALGLSNNRYDLIGRMIADAGLADFPADTVIFNTGDYWTMRLAKDTTGRYLLGDPGSNIAPSLFGLNVIVSNAMPAGNVWVGNLAQAATMHTREGMTVEMSDSDQNNFQLNLITIRAERRLALTVERPAAARYGALVPA